MIALMLMLSEPQHHGMAMPGMAMDMPQPKPTPAKAKRGTPRVAKSVRKPSARTNRPTGPETCSAEHAAMGHCRVEPHDMGAMPGMAETPVQLSLSGCSPEHAAMGHCQPDAATPMGHAAMPGMAGAPGADIGHAPPPPPPGDRAADRFHDPAGMAAAYRRMRAEHGGMRFSQILFNLAEVQLRNGRDSYRWDGEGWFGGDIDRLVVKSEGEGGLGDRIGAAEVQALYSRAIDPYWNVQAGVRQDVGAGARRTYAVLGVEGLAPYWFDVEGMVFLSDKGELHGRADAWVDQRLTQRAILQPRMEVNLSAQDVPEQGIAAGVSSVELGLRLRYEIAREFSPYVGIAWERRYGPAAGGGAALALGIRTWF